MQSKITKKLNFSLSQNRTHVIKEEFPRLAYLISDVIVFLETVDFTRIQDYLAKFQKFVSATQKGVLSASTPSLLIVQNKVDPPAVANRLSVSEATEDFFNLAFPFCRTEQPTSRRGDSKAENAEATSAPTTPLYTRRSEETKRKKKKRKPKTESNLSASPGQDSELKRTRKKSEPNVETTNTEPKLKRKRSKTESLTSPSLKQKQPSPARGNEYGDAVIELGSSPELEEKGAEAGEEGKVKEKKKRSKKILTLKLSKGEDSGAKGETKRRKIRLPDETIVPVQRAKTLIQENVEKVSQNVKEGVGGVAAMSVEKVRQMGGEIGASVDAIKGKVIRSTDSPSLLTEEDRMKEDRRKMNEFINSFETIRCVRIPNYRYVGSIEPYLKAFRDEVKKLVNQQAAKKLKAGTNYPESIWLDIVKELVQSCTSFSDNTQIEIRMAQIVGKVLQPTSGEQLEVSIYNFFNLLLNNDHSKENFLRVREITEDYLSLILANQLRKAGTKLETKALIFDPKHPVCEFISGMFTAGQNAISSLIPCEYKLNKKECCTQLQKDHGELHRFSAGKKKQGALVFEEPPGFSLEERKTVFLKKVYKNLRKFHRDVANSIVVRIQKLSKVEKPDKMKSKQFNSEFLRCVLCFSNQHNTLVQCRHSFCQHCMKEVEDINKTRNVPLSCPLCEAPLKQMQDSYIVPGRAGYRVLSLDGGGIKGIIELCVIGKILEYLPGVELYQLFDLVVGTSTGALVGTALAICKKKLEETVHLYKQFPGKVFKKSMVTNVNVLKVAYLLMGGKHLYRIRVLEELLAELVGMDCDFIETMNDPTTPKVALVSTNYSANPMRYFFLSTFSRLSNVFSPPLLLPPFHFSLFFYLDQLYSVIMLVEILLHSMKTLNCFLHVKYIKDSLLLLLPPFFLRLTK